MKTWLRLTLVTITVGGGFTGMAVTLQEMLAHQQPFLGVLLMLVFLGLFAFVLASGLVFVHNPNRTGLLIAALVLQIPWISSPFLAYRFGAGFQLFVGIMGARISENFRLGADFQVNFFQRLPWGCGINVFALILLILLLKERNKSKELPQVPAAVNV